MVKLVSCASVRRIIPPEGSGWGVLQGSMGWTGFQKSPCIPMYCSENSIYCATQNNIEITSEKLCLKINWDNLVNSYSWHCASAMQSDSKLRFSYFFFFYFSSCKCIIYPRIGGFGILGYKNVPDIVGPLANIWYKCCFIHRSIESVSVQCCICS